VAPHSELGKFVVEAAEHGCPPAAGAGHSST
jgi:hypothetical protein